MNFDADLLSEYESAVALSDRLPRNSLTPAILGLMGEIGEVLTTAKKVSREKDAFGTFTEHATEEFGDAFWYLSATSGRLGFPISGLVPKAVLRSDDSGQQVELHETLLSLFDACSKLSVITQSGDPEGILHHICWKLLVSMRACGIKLDDVVRANLAKVRGRFLPLDFNTLPNFDSGFPPEEQLPLSFEFQIKERRNGQTYLSKDGVNVGDPLTDNINGDDGYRFHDVFHMANAAILHWSPVTRALLKIKRKSDALADRTEDSGRAIVIEEGLSAWIFAKAKRHQMFDGAETVSFDLLKGIAEFVGEYEVHACPLALWERSIIQGYEAFRKLRAAGQGIIVGNRLQRTILFKPL